MKTDTAETTSILAGSSAVNVVTSMVKKSNTLMTSIVVLLGCVATDLRVGFTAGTRGYMKKS